MVTVLAIILVRILSFILNSVEEENMSDIHTNKTKKLDVKGSVFV